MGMRLVTSQKHARLLRQFMAYYQTLSSSNYRME